MEGRAIVVISDQQVRIRFERMRRSVFAMYLSELKRAFPYAEWDREEEYWLLPKRQELSVLAFSYRTFGRGRVVIRRIKGGRSTPDHNWTQRRLF